MSNERRATASDISSGPQVQWSTAPEFAVVSEQLGQRAAGQLRKLIDQIVEAAENDETSSSTLHAHLEFRIEEGWTDRHTTLPKRFGDQLRNRLGLTLSQRLVGPQGLPAIEGIGCTIRLTSQPPSGTLKERQSDIATVSEFATDIPTSPAPLTEQYESSERHIVDSIQQAIHQSGLGEWEFGATVLGIEDELHAVQLVRDLLSEAPSQSAINLFIAHVGIPQQSLGDPSPEVSRMRDWIHSELNRIGIDVASLQGNAVSANILDAAATLTGSQSPRARMIVSDLATPAPRFESVSQFADRFGVPPNRDIVRKSDSPAEQGAALIKLAAFDHPETQAAVNDWLRRLQEYEFHDMGESRRVVELVRLLQSLLELHLLYCRDQSQEPATLVVVERAETGRPRFVVKATTPDKQSKRMQLHSAAAFPPIELG